MATAKLSDRTCQIAPAGKHMDGTVRGLYLLVSPAGARSWVLRYQLTGRRRDMGLGPYPEITLARAREKALDARRLAKEGTDPLSLRHRVTAITFKAVAEELIAAKQHEWRNAKHRAQWSSTLAAYVYPKLGTLDVKDVDTGAVLAVPKPIWTAKPETATRGARKGENPARWQGHLVHMLPKPGKVRAVAHHAALPWSEAPTFVSELMRREGTAAKALALTILTAARSGEARGMTWGEIDIANAVWAVPGGRMKAGKEHRMPLVAEAMALLGEPGGADGFVFPSPMKSDRPLSDMTLGAVLKQMGRSDLTVHGFRSTFRD